MEKNRNLEIDDFEEEIELEKYKEKCFYRKSRKSFRTGLFYGIVLGIGIIFLLQYANTYVAMKKGTATAAVSNRETINKLEQLATIVDRYYYDSVESQQLQEGIYSGFMDSLGDVYSQYYNPEEYQSLVTSTTGSYYGVGAVLTQDQETMQVTILHVYPGSPAAEAGICDGDILKKVEEVSAESEDLSELVKKIKGEEGTKVHMTVQREGVEELLEFEVERRKVQVPTVDYQMLEDKVGYIQITEFSDLTPGQFESAVSELNVQGMTAMIVDVRDNPGGVLDAVSEVLDQILPEGLMVYTQDKYGNRKEYRSSGDTFMDIPLVVLTNENSASASEIFAGAIKDYEYGTLIGTKTFGKGIVQQILSLEDGSAVKVTMAKYFTPKGNYIHEKGIEPDIELKYEYLGEDDTEYTLMYDNQILKALEVLKEK